MVYLYPNTPAYLLVSAFSPALQVGLCGALLLTTVPTAGKQLQKSIRRSLHQWRRRRTAKALHALRYDREYLLGQLPPIVSAQILSYLDRASLASLRASCRQASLLVAATGGAKLRLELPGVVHYTDVPLSAVWPRLKVLSLSLHATRDSTSAWLRPHQDSSHHVSIGSALSAGSRGAGEGPDVGKNASEPPSADCSIADAALRGFLVSRGLQDLPCMRMLDMSHCSASFELDTWQLLARALPDGCTLVVPVSALQGARRTGYASRAAQVHQVLPALKALATRSSPPPSRHEEGRSEGQEQSAWDNDSKLQARRHKGLWLELVGVNLQVSSYPALEELCRIGTHLLVRLALSETYPHAGHLPWGPLTLLSSLRELSVTPATPASLAALLGVLPALPNLTHLALGDVGSAHSIARSLQTPVPGVNTANADSACTVVQAKEMQQLQACPKLTHLELHTLRLPPTVEMEAPFSSDSRSVLGSASLVATHHLSASTTRTPTSATPSSPSPAAAAAALGSNSSSNGDGQSATVQGGHHAAGPSLARITLPPLNNLQSLSLLHVEVARPRHMGPAQEAPPSAEPFLHLFPGLTHLDLGVCPRSSRRISMGLTHAAAAAANSTATALAAASSSDALDPSGAAAAAAAAAGLPVPRPPPLLPLLAGLPHLCSLGLAGVWASQCVREKEKAATAPGAPASSVSMEVALAGLRHAEVYYCVSYDQLLSLLYPVLNLPHLNSLGLHFCGTAPKKNHLDDLNLQLAEVHQRIAAFQLQSFQEIQAVLGTNHPLPNVAAGGAMSGHNVPDGAAAGGGGGLRSAGNVGGGDISSFHDDLKHVATMVAVASSLRSLTIEGGDFQLAQMVCMSASHHYQELTLINCDMLLECDVIAALNTRANRLLLSDSIAPPPTIHAKRFFHENGLPTPPALQSALEKLLCPLKRIQVLNCRGIDGGSLEMAAIKLKLPMSVDVVCTDWRCIEEAFGTS